MNAPTTFDTAALPPQLHDLLSSTDAAAFEQALDALVRQREQHTFRALGHLARDLHEAIRRLGGDLVVPAGQTSTITNARVHLQDVLRLSDEAAHRHIDFAERTRPQAEALAKNASHMLEWATPGDPAAVLAQQAHSFATHCDEGLSDMMVAQSWQDLSGQRINQVVRFIESVEASLLDLVRLTGELAGREPPPPADTVHSQDEADRILSEFGF